MALNKIPYDDKYCKYPLPSTVNKNEINWNLKYMQYGGSQLLEIMEKEFPLEWIKENAKMLKLGVEAILRLEKWLEYNTIVNKVKEHFHLNDSLGAKYFFYKGGGLLRKLYRMINLEPIILENGEIESRYSFIDYDVIQNNNYMLVISKIKKERWSDDKITNEDIEMMKQEFLYRKEENGKLIKCLYYESDETAENYEALLNTYELTQKLIK